MNKYLTVFFKKGKMVNAEGKGVNVVMLLRDKESEKTMRSRKEED